MKTEEEIKERRARLMKYALSHNQMPLKNPLYGDPYIEHLQSILRVETAAVLRVLGWVLGEDHE